MFGRIVMAATLLAVSSSAVMAEAVSKKSLRALSGMDRRLALLGAAEAGCKPSPLKVSVVTQPSNGSVEVKKGLSKPGALSECPALRVRVEAVIYRSNAGYSGTDRTVVRVEDPRGNVQLMQFDIDVKASDTAPM
ncbi:MAG: hypothetical protein BGN83_15240 [Rhizobium sp. 63-7]|nr:MAG: hypothetical protein BGN83_15240 [Rhizobium sp. 63-7]